METANRKMSRRALSDGSALILTVVLTSLLAIIGVLFVMASRIDKMATSSISDNKDLNLAVDTIVEQISQVLALDVPGMPGQEYYDYPNAADTWLASFEPYRDVTGYRWQQVSDIYNRLGPDLQLPVEVVPEYQDFSNVVNVQDVQGLPADADGDGVADSQWVIIPEMSSGKGRPIYAAIRIVDNGAMLNANTAYKFDPSASNFTVFDIGGSSQMQINLLALTDRPADPYDLPDPNDEVILLKARANPDYGLNYLDLVKYANNVLWRYNEPNGPYTPFDISDELEFRYRFLLNHSDIDTRLEEWGGNFRLNTLSTPVMSGGRTLDAWFTRISDYGGLDPNYSYRHITTTYNMDRIINPNGQKMVNVNTANVNELYAAIINGLANGPNNVRDEQLAAQLAVNIIDLRDHYRSDPNMEVTVLPVGSTTYYGFEAQPFINELAFRISETSPDISASNYFAIELSNPFDVDIPLGDFRLEVRNPIDPNDPNGTVVGIINLSGHVLSDGSQIVITNGNAASGAFGVSGMISTGGCIEDPALVLATYEAVEDSDPPEYALKNRYDVYLIRRTPTPAGDIYLDKQQTQDDWFVWDANNVNISQFYARRDNDWNIVYQEVEPASNTLGSSNGLDGMRRNYNFYNFANADERFVSVGDIARAFTIGPSTDPNDMIGVKLGTDPNEELVRLDLQDPNYTDIFQYLTVIDPMEHIDPPIPPDPNNYTDNQLYLNDYALFQANYQLYLNETRIKGRININTAPWFVIAQLPWITNQLLPPDDPNRYDLAKAIVAYRDTVVGAYNNIAALMQVPEMGFYANDANDLIDYPDLTHSDNAIDDFEERDVIFSRISNIVTVRSDVFTAYILVRIGIDGPQKRVLAILDRSQVTSSGGRVKILALHQVPDPR